MQSAFSSQNTMIAKLNGKTVQKPQKEILIGIQRLFSCGISALVHLNDYLWSAFSLLNSSHIF